jgi:trans-aconitate 2-methyltransferase
MTQATPHQRNLAGESWDPGQYLKFADHRLRPALDLMGRIPVENPRVVYDLGCGGGNVTRILAHRWPGASVIGMDNSPDMLEQAGSVRAGELPGNVSWERGDLADWRPNQIPTVFFSNAVIQWVPDHHELVPRLWNMLPSGACLAVQAPLSWDMRSHQIMRETLENGGRGGQAVGSAELRSAVSNRWVQDPDFYYDLLAPEADHLDVWTTEYQHVLAGDDAVLEWVTGTGLRPILNGLEDGDRETYLGEYRRRLNVEYPKRADGFTLYPFRRLFFVAVRR